MIWKIWLLAWGAYAWSYANQGAWSGECRGMQQSPVELPLRLFLQKRDKDELEFFYEQMLPATQLADTGKWLQITFASDPGYVRWRQKDYHLTHIEFHSVGAGLGHVVNLPPDPFAEVTQESHSMELELIHVSPEEGDQIALSVMCDVAEHDRSPWFDSMVPDLTQLAEAAATGSNHVEMTARIDMPLFVSQVVDWSYFWDYDGSLSSPPCTEGVRRFVCGTECVLSKEFSQGMDGFESMMSNSRSPQPLWDRKVYYNSTHWKPPEPEVFDYTRILLPFAILTAVVVVMVLCCKLVFQDPECCDNCLTYTWLCCKSLNYFCCIYLGPMWLCCINCIRHSLYLPEYKENPFSSKEKSHRDDGYFEPRHQRSIGMDDRRRHHQGGHYYEDDPYRSNNRGSQRWDDANPHVNDRKPHSRNIYDTPYHQNPRSFPEQRYRERDWESLDPNDPYSHRNRLNSHHSPPDDRNRLNTHHSPPDDRNRVNRHSPPDNPESSLLTDMTESAGSRNHRPEPPNERVEPQYARSRSAFARGMGDREYSPYNDMRDVNKPAIGGIRSQSLLSPNEHSNHPRSQSLTRTHPQNHYNPPRNEPRFQSERRYDRSNQDYHDFNHYNNFHDHRPPPMDSYSDRPPQRFEGYPHHNNTMRAPGETPDFDSRGYRRNSRNYPPAPRSDGYQARDHLPRQTSYE